MLCYALLSSVTLENFGVGAFMPLYRSRDYIRMQKMHKIIASLTPEDDGRTTRARSS